MRLLKSYNFPTIFKTIDLMGGRKWLFLACITAFCGVEITGNILYTIGIRGAINSLSGTVYNDLLWSVFLIFLSRATWWVYAPISSYCCSWSSKGTVQRLKTDLVDHIIRLPINEHDKHPNGELLSILSNDIDCLQRIYDWYFFQIRRTLIGGIAGIILMAAIDWRFAIVVFALGSISVLVTSKFNAKLKKGGETLQQALAQTSTDSYELIKGTKTLRLLRLQNYLLTKVSSSSQLEANSKIENGIILSRLKSIVSMITAVTYAAILIAGAMFVHFGLTEWGTVVSIMGLKTVTDMLFIEFGDFMAGMQTCIGGVNRLLSIMAIPIEVNDDVSRITITPSAHLLSMNNVSFAYSDVPVLKGFNLLLPRKGLTVLIGETGSGKSTAIKLVLGLYSIQNGNINYDGNEPSTLESIRAKTAYVPQEPLLFRGSILENILFGSDTGALADAVKAARLAGADTFISEMEQGYDTILIDDGKSLSGGQKQRIAIARALVKNAPILLFDEITSALDKDTENHIMATILEIAKEKSVLFITHRNTIIEKADNVYRI